MKSEVHFFMKESNEQEFFALLDGKYGKVINNSFLYELWIGLILYNINKHSIVLISSLLFLKSYTEFCLQNPVPLAPSTSKASIINALSGIRF